MARTNNAPLNLTHNRPAIAGIGTRSHPPAAAANGPGRLVASILALRQPLPWAGSVGVPLAVTAVTLTGTWWALVPLMVCVWLCTTASWAWSCLVAMETGLLGALWAALGTYALTAWPSHRPMVGAIWALSAAAIAAIAFLRRRSNRS